MSLSWIVLCLGLVAHVYCQEKAAITLAADGPTLFEAGLSAKLVLTCTLNVRTGNDGDSWRYDLTSEYMIQKKQDEGWLDVNNLAELTGVFADDQQMSVAVTVTGPPGQEERRTVLEIPAVRETDAGKYRCQYKPTISSEGINSEEIEVAVNALHFDLTAISAASAQSDVAGLKSYEVEKDDNMVLTCKETGGKPGGAVKVRVGLNTEETESMDNDDDTAWEGSTGYKTKNKTVVVTKVVSGLPDIAGQDLICQSLYDDTVNLERKIRIHFKDSPKITCAEKQISAKMGGKATLACTVTGQVDEIWWEIPDGGSVKKLENADTFSGRFTVATDDQQKKSTLMITGLKNRDFQTYKMAAKNKFGETRFNILLQKKTSSQETSDNGASGVLPSVASFVLTCLLSLLL